MRGFTLIEISLALIVIGLLANATLRPLSARIEQHRRAVVDAQLSAAREALIGFLIANGHLPCPVAVGSSPPAAESVNGACHRQHGRLPAGILGLGGARDVAGAVLDPWGQHLYYAVSLASHADRGDPAVPDWTNAGESVAVGARNLAADLELCRNATPGPCTGRALLADGIVAMVYSYGADRSTAGAQGENQDQDRTFVLQPPSVNPAQAFDDHLLWLSKSELSYWLLRAEWLP